MSDSTEKIKEQIIKELGLLSYLEKKKVQDNLDEKFVKDELTSIRKHKRVLTYFSFFWFLISSAMIVLFIIGLDISSSSNSKIFHLLLGLIYLAISVMSIVQNTRLNKRESLYKVLSVFANNK